MTLTDQSPASDDRRRLALESVTGPMLSLVLCDSVTVHFVRARARVVSNVSTRPSLTCETHEAMRRAFAPSCALEEPVETKCLISAADQLRKIRCLVRARARVFLGVQRVP